MLKSILVVPFLMTAALAGTISPTVFDIPPQAGQVLKVEGMGVMVPISVFSVRGGMSREELMRALPDFTFQKLSSEPWVDGETPRAVYFEKIHVDWEDGKMRNLTLSADRLPPTQGRMLAMVKELERLLGKPTLVGRERFLDDKNEKSLVLQWRKPEGAIFLEMERSGDFLEMDLDYYPGADNVAIPRVDRSSKPEPLAYESVDQLMGDFIEDLGFFPEGDGARPPLEVPVGEKNMLAEINKLDAFEDGGFRARDWKEFYEPVWVKLQAGLNEHYKDLTAAERFDRLLMIAEGKVEGMMAGEVQCGAATFLGGYDDPLVFDYLIKGMDVELPAGVAMECAEGLGRICKGEVMDRVVAMYQVRGGGDKANQILMNLKTKQQIRELKGHALKARGYASVMLREIISQLEDRETGE